MMIHRAKKKLRLLKTRCSWRSFGIRCPDAYIPIINEFVPIISVVNMSEIYSLQRVRSINICRIYLQTRLESELKKELN